MRLRNGLASYLVAIWLSGCLTGLSDNDAEMLQDVRSKFAERYELSPDGIYLAATARDGVVPTVEEAAEIYRSFWLPRGAPRRDSDLVYLNVYNDSGSFAFQLYWDDSTGPVVSHAEHY